MSEKIQTKQKPEARSKRSEILYQITTLLVVVLIALGLAIFFLVRASQNRLIEKSIEKLVDTEVEGINSALIHFANIYGPIIDEMIGDVPIEELIKAFMNKEEIEVLSFVSEEFQSMIEDGLLGIDSVFWILPASAINPDTLVIASNETDLVYSWEIPDYIEEAIEEGRLYIWMEEGIPELDLEGEYLISVIEIQNIDEADDEIPPPTTFLVAIRPMSEDKAEITAFYNDEKTRLNVLLGLVISGSIIFVILISFFVLRYLISKRITEPIDELSAVAEEVMGGNLDVEIEVHKGEEFEGLKRTFRDMVESIREIIAKSVEDG